MREGPPLRPLGEALRAGQIRWVIVPRRKQGAILAPTQIVAEERAFDWEKEAAIGNKMILLETTTVSGR